MFCLTAVVMIGFKCANVMKFTLIPSRSPFDKFRDQFVNIFNRYINYFATKQSPTEHVLDLWEARHREDSAVTDLLNSLRVMGRMDAAAIIENELTLEPWL